jgi:hypothetical protein
VVEISRDVKLKLKEGKDYFVVGDTSPVPIF